MEIIDCEACGKVLAPDTFCDCIQPVDYLYAVTYRVVPHEEEE